jgi:general secretion pathway protein D
MKIAAAAVFLSVAPGFAVRANAQSASTWNKRGETAELKQDYDTAYEDYLKAQQKNPKDLRYQTRLDRMRFQAAAQHVDRGRVLRQNNDLAGALNEFSRALQIDPGNEAAAQEIQITQNLDRKSSTGLVPTPADTSFQRDLASIAGPMELKPVSDEPITLHMVEDTKNLYTAIGKLAGLNVLFDPDYVSRRVPLDLDRVSLPDALRILGIEASTFYKVLTPDSIYVAQNNHQKHADLDDLAVQTFYLSNPAQQADANEIYTALRQLLPPDIKSFFVPSQNAIILRGTHDELTLAGKVLNDLDRARAEVVVDVAILEVNRDKTRRLGITLPQSITFTPQSGTTNSTSTTSTSTTTGTTTTNSDFTLNTLGNFKATNLAVNLTGATVDALLSDSDTRVLQNPSIRATDGQQATMKIGSRIPVATGSYSAGAATGITAGIGVQTQFSYQDVGVNIDMTPTIHLNRDVTLKLTVEVSNHSGDVTISGVTEPIIGQRSTKTTIELKDGEPCLLAGIITKQDNATISGTPGLAQVPFLKYFFGSNFKENAQDEVVFILIPHIVRESVLTRQNTRLIDTGTTNDIQLRRSSAALDQLFPDSSVVPPPPSSTTSAANAAVAMAQQLNQQTLPPSPKNPTAAGPATPTTPAAAVPSPGPATPGTVTGPIAKPDVTAGPPVSLVVVPQNSNQTVGSTFVTSIVLTNARDLASVPLQVQFDPKVLQLVNVEAGGLLGGDGQPVALVHRDEGNGVLNISASRPPGAAGVSGEGQVCLMTFKAIAPGDSKLALVKVGARTTTNNNVPAVGTQAMVHVK